MTIYLKGCVFLLLLSCFHGSSRAQRVYSIDLESELRSNLYARYQKLQRPASTVVIRASLNLLYINGLDIKTQTMSTSGYFSLLWNDDRLRWAGNSTYNNVNFLFSSQSQTWRPSIVIENSNTELVIFSDPDALLRIRPDGMVTWTPGGVFNTQCDADVTYYPLDTQTCTISITTWAYTLQEIRLDFQLTPIILDNFKENGEWEIVDHWTHYESIFRAGDATNSYSRLYFHFKLRRRPLFHILNTLFPVILMASLICFVFKLPPESGERVGMSLTVLLAYAVYLTLIAENIPQTSLRASILSTYLTIILMLSALSVVFTIIVLDIYFNHEDDEDVPEWIQKVTKVLLVRLACWKGCTKCCKSKKTCPEKVGGNGFAHGGQVSLQDLDNSPHHRHPTGKDRVISLQKSPPENTEVGVGDADEPKYSWKEVALILDKCLMYLFIFMVALCTVVCVGLLAGKAAE